MQRGAERPAPNGGAGDGTVGKALDLLDRVAERGRPVRFSELQGEAGLPKATLHRLLQTLTNQGMLHYDDERHTYGPGLRLVRLAHAAWAQSALAPLARPVIDRLAAEVRETVHLAQLERGQVLYVDKRNAERPVQMFAQAGKVGPGYCTGVGKAMLAFLDDAARRDAVNRQAFFAHTPATIASAAALEAELATIRAEGIAYDREEHEPGIICIAAPILSARGRMLGALSITTTTARHALADLDAWRPVLLAAAQDIAAAAEAWQFPD
ncbi:IclR family transcriptional regulator [Roseivivax isoporae]|uniref:IclR family transcriptional regulator n=1 Tax=Roseivivax isoporae LMG 25204 TaxID=1449351 RepID=X7F6I3_9RHOB|nr:IclR family transcriptional regulator [Roseivivax isoporae]ETX28353.1 IclR family transcriptional regulator [Roseivivax isoporae LMG 25204]